MLEGDARLIVVWFASEPWYGLWQRHQHLVSRMGKDGHKIIYVDPTNLLSGFKTPLNFLKPIERIDSNIIIVRPFFLPFHYKLGMIESYDSMMTSILIRVALRRFREERPDVLCLSSPFFSFIKERFSDVPVVYDCVDACEGFLDKEHVASWMLEREQDLIDSADAVLTVSNGLHIRCACRNPKTYLIPNGVSLWANSGKTPSDLEGLKRPIIGFIGRMGNWVDFDLLVELAKSRPNYSIVLIGPLDEKNAQTKKLEQMDNVHFLGTKEYADLVNYIGPMDVCTIPFKLQILTKMGNPIKLLEYASQGKPIVSTPLDGVMEFSDIVYTSDGTSKGFVDKIDEALSENDIVLQEARKKRAKQYDWESITSKVENILVEVSDRKSRDLKRAVPTTDRVTTP